MAVHPAVPAGRWPELGPPAGLRDGGRRKPVPTLHDVRPGIGDIANAIVLTDAGARLDRPAGVPLSSPSASGTGLRTKWPWALAASGVLHAAVAAFLLVAGSTAILIEGSDDAGITMLGNAANDELQAGEPADQDVTQVTIISMLPAQPIATVDAEAVAVDAAEPVTATSPASEVIEAAPADAVEPVRDAAAEPVAPESAVPVPESTTAPQVLTAETVDPAEDNRIAPQVETQDAESAPAAESAIVPPAAVAIPAESPPAASSPAPQPVERLQPETETQPAATDEVRVSEAETIRAEEDVPVVKPEPEEVKQPERKKPETKKAEPQKAETKPAREKKAEKAEKPARENADGARGNGRANTRKGTANGAQDGRTVAKGKGGKSGAGNAAVSNYPGKVAAKLRRAARSISRSAIRKAKNDVQVGFTVRADGSVGGIRITRSSGSPELDRAALTVVQRAAPFPPIPEGAGRSSWAFALPLGVAR